MERAALLAWLAEVHEIREERDLNYPLTPALAALLHLRYDFEWDDRCYQEVQMLGEASGLHFKEYVRVQPTHLNRPGDCAMNPIVLDDEVSERPLHEDTPLERVPKLQRRPGSCESVGSASAAGFPSASAWKSFRPTLSQLQPEKASSSSEANGISSPKFESTTQSYNPDEAELTTESEEYRECWRSMPYLGPDFIVPSRKELYPAE
ncbi:hypothetical protein KC19_4G147300 [Ceratodon purpureus]|uniref:Uncharacterized protein n=1 Tax=Ceratodon purpureus TaxID=3225 RepID=A0A8T0IAS4_CERPU|nr:hypothetical protein KC19_4G147300 [Ceratodon purpureus]